MDDHQKRFLSKLDREKRHRSGLPGDDDEPLPEPVEPISGQDQPGRNDPCPCGSGKKYKKCCGRPS
jgi:preprotein translocase subunit SecA